MLNCQHAIMEDLINSRKVTVQGLLNYSWDGDMQLVFSYSNCIYCLETNSFIDWSPLSHVSLHVVVATNPHNSECSFCFSLTHWLSVSLCLKWIWDHANIKNWFFVSAFISVWTLCYVNILTSPFISKVASHIHSAWMTVGNRWGTEPGIGRSTY